MSTPPKLTCDRARHLLAARQADPGGASGEQALGAHLDTCPACREYGRMLVRLEAELAVDTHRAHASGAGLDRLHAAVRRNRPRPSLWSAFEQLVQVKVPAYQALVGAAAAAALVVALLPAPHRAPGPAWTRAPGDSVAVALTRADSYRVDQMLSRLDGQRRGPAADTLLSRYLSRQAASASGSRVAM